MHREPVILYSIINIQDKRGFIIDFNNNNHYFDIIISHETHPTLFLHQKLNYMKPYTIQNNDKHRTIVC